MRPISICLPLVFLSMVGSATLTAQTQPAASQKPAQTAALKTSSAQSPHKTIRRHSTSHRSWKTAARKGAKRPDYRPEYSEDSVEVINGDATRKVVFHDEPPAATAKNVPAALKNAPAPMKVEVVNGTSTDTRYFYDNGEDQRIEAALNRPVVIGVESSDTRMAGGNKHPVVTRVTAGGPDDAKGASSGGQPVMRSISPRPKRPVYQPDMH